MADLSSRAKLHAAWNAEVVENLHDEGYARLPELLSRAQCRQLIDVYDDPAAFRKTVVMARHGFGRGEYRYFAQPLPEVVSTLRHTLYERLVPVANAWWERLGFSERFPPSLVEYRERLQESGQLLPTPLLLRYGVGDYNCLHQDLYGELSFPMQATILLDRPQSDFLGGEFVLVEQRPRMQSRPIVIPLEQGDCVVFPCRFRPRPGVRGFHRAAFRHGVSVVRQGSRHALGIIFHDATS